MIKSLTFKNFKALRDSTLPLGPFTLIVGPNGSGKSSVFQAMEALRNAQPLDWKTVMSAGEPPDPPITISGVFGVPIEGCSATLTGGPGGARFVVKNANGADPSQIVFQRMVDLLGSLRVYSFLPDLIARPATLVPTTEIGPNGQELAVVIDRLRDNHPERFEALNEELGRWLPEFDRVLFDTPSQGTRAIQLRTRSGGHAIPAAQLSQGTLVALAILTLAHLPNPPSIVCLEEPDHGMHPRLLRDVQDAIYRLAYPKEHGEGRPPVQVIATTHSPYFLDLFREHREEIVIAHKLENNVRFERLSEYPNIEEILQDTHLGDVWYTGVLGGVPGER